MGVALILLLALLASVASASQNPRPLVEHSIRVEGHVTCAGVPLENATVNLVFVVPSPDKDANSDELTSVNGPVDFDSVQSVADSLDHFWPVSSLDDVVGNDTEAGEVPAGYDYPDNDTDITFFNRVDVEPVGNGASLAFKENVSAETVDDVNDYTPTEYELPHGQGPEMPSESEDVLDSTLTSGNGAYHVEGKILYAPGDTNWKLRLKVEHNCENGTIKDHFAVDYKKDLATYGIYGEGKKQFQVDVEVSVDENDYKSEESADY